MTTEMISLKLEKNFLSEIDTLVKKESYQSRTEFIRDAVRDKIEDIKMKKSFAEIAKLRGISKRKTTDEELEQVREQVFNELNSKLR